MTTPPRPPLRPAVDRHQGGWGRLRQDRPPLRLRPDRGPRPAAPAARASHVRRPLQDHPRARGRRATSGRLRRRRSPAAAFSDPSGRRLAAAFSDPARTRLGRSAVGTLRSEAFNVRMEERRLLALSLPPMPARPDCRPCRVQLPSRAGAVPARPLLPRRHAAPDARHPARGLEAPAIPQDARGGRAGQGALRRPLAAGRLQCICVYRPTPSSSSEASTALGRPAHVSGRRLPSRRRRRSSSRCPSEATVVWGRSLGP